MDVIPVPEVTSTSIAHLITVSPTGAPGFFLAQAAKGAARPWLLRAAMRRARRDHAPHPAGRRCRRWRPRQHRDRHPDRADGPAAPRRGTRIRPARASTGRHRRNLSRPVRRRLRGEPTTCPSVRPAPARRCSGPGRPPAPACRRSRTCRHPRHLPPRLADRLRIRGERNPGMGPGADPRSIARPPGLPRVQRLDRPGRRIPAPSRRHPAHRRRPDRRAPHRMPGSPPPAPASQGTTPSPTPQRNSPGSRQDSSKPEPPARSPASGRSATTQQHS